MIDMSMLNEIQNELNKVNTENGDTAYESTFNANLDFFGVSGALRNRQGEVNRLFNEALEEDLKTALKNMFYLRDIRGGLGERDSFRTCLKVIIKKDPELSKKLIPFIVEYGRWDDLLVYLDYESVAKEATNFISQQLIKDYAALENNKGVSLCAKWMPSINASSYKTRDQAKKLCKSLNMSYEDYRKLLSNLRKGNIIERNLSEKDYTFKYEHVPGKAMSKYTVAFIRNDNDRYSEYIQSLKSNKVKAKVKTLYPYEIIRNIYKDPEFAELQWKSIKRSKDNGNTIVVRDGSGSMYGLPEEVATSLSMLFAEQLTGEFKDKFITFSDNPKLVEVKGNTLQDKVERIRRYNEMATTNIEKVYNLLYDVSLKVEDPKDYIQRVVIISDMEFNIGTRGVPTYEDMKRKFDEANIPLPEIVYWDVDARRTHFAAKADQPNIRLVSGKSNNIIDAIINNEAVDANDFMLKTLSKYDFVDELI